MVGKGHRRQRLAIRNKADALVFITVLLLVAACNVADLPKGDAIPNEAVFLSTTFGRWDLTIEANDTEVYRNTARFGHVKGKLLVHPDDPYWENFGIDEMCEYDEIGLEDFFLLLPVLEYYEDK